MSRSHNTQTRYSDHSLFKEARALRRQGLMDEASAVEASVSFKTTPRYGNQRKQVAHLKDVSRRAERRANNRNAKMDIWEG